MKFRLLFWMRGKGRAGSSPSGESTGSTSRSKYCSSHWEVLSSHEFARQQLDSLLRERGQQDVVETRVLRVHQPASPLVDGVELLGDREPVRARLVGTEFECSA